MLKYHIETKLQATFSPLYLKVEDESHLHKGHAASRPGGETHFRVTLASFSFQGLSRVERHQKVYACLKDELKEKIHALSLKALSPEEALPL